MALGLQGAAERAGTAGARDVLRLAVAYAKQETLEPIKGLGRFIAFGVALGWVRLRSDSVWPGIVAHGLFNALALIAVYAELRQ